jgi:adenine-specific DNA-methyltransferase
VPPRKQARTSTPVQSIKHKDKRANIPTEELRDFAKLGKLLPEK